MMDIVETWHVKLMSELEFMGHGIDMMRPHTHEVVMTSGKDSTCDTNEELFSGVGMTLKA